MGDDWDPFGDPADAPTLSMPIPNSSSPTAKQLPESVPAGPNRDMLQTWEIEELEREEKRGAGILLPIPTVSELERELSAPPRFSKKDAISMEDALIAAYQAEDFQRKLREAWVAAGDDAAKRAKARQEACLPIQLPIISRYGFEASKRGVLQSVSAFVPWNDDPEIAERNAILNRLVNPDLQEIQESQVVFIPNEDLVVKALAGDVSAVRQLLDAKADPNTIWLREERLKGSDGCCSCAISSEEYTPLMAACLEHHKEVADLLLEHSAIDINFVCCGLMENEPYKHFTALDVAKQAKNSLVGRLEGIGGKSAKALPEPRWPRSKKKAFAEPPPRPTSTSTEPDRVSAQVKDVPLPVPERSSSELEHITRQLVDTMREHQGDLQEARARLFKQLMLQWHPDKRAEGERELATSVCQWLLGPAKCFTSEV